VWQSTTHCERHLQRNVLKDICPLQ
jgi:hypothetical protein